MAHLDVLEAASKVICEIGTIRIVGADVSFDKWGDTVYMVHPHIMDLYNTRDVDSLEHAIAEATGMQCVYDPDDNAFCMRSKK